MIRRPPRSTPLYSSAASDVYKRQVQDRGLAARAEAPVRLQRTEGRVGTSAGRLQGVRGRFLAGDPAHGEREAQAVGRRAPFTSEPLSGSLVRIPSRRAPRTSG